MARGMGSKDADNAIKGGTDYQSSLAVLPSLSQVHRRARPGFDLSSISPDAAPLVS